MKFAPTLHKLPNGITVILDPMDTATSFVSVGFKTGSRDEKANEAGLTHFCEHMLCKGTKRFPDRNALKNYIMDNGGNSNAVTSDKYIQLYGQIVAENTGALVDVFADQLQNSLFAPDKIEIERQIIADELHRKMDSPASQEAEFASDNFFNGQTSPYQTLGTFENIVSFTREQMKMFMSRRMTGKNCVVCVSGNLGDTSQMLADIERKFSFLKPIDVKNNDKGVLYNPGAKNLTRPDKKNILIGILIPGQFANTPEMHDARMCVGRFNAYLRDELFNVLRTENGLVYGCDVFKIDLPKLTMYQIETATKPENLEKTVALIAKTARRVQTDDKITDEFIKRSFNRGRLGDAVFLESPEQRCNKLFKHFIEYGELYKFNEIVKRASEITANDVIEKTRNYFAGPISFATTGPDYSVDLCKIWNENYGPQEYTKQNIMINHGTER